MQIAMQVEHLTGSTLDVAPDVALFGIGEPNAVEMEFMAGSPLRRYLAHDVRRLGATAAAEAALERVHGRQQQFVLHIDLNVIDPEDFRAATPAIPGGARSGGLRLSELREALAVFARQPTLAALEISSYNPSLDPDGETAKELIELIVEILARRLEKPAEVLPPLVAQFKEDDNVAVRQAILRTLAKLGPDAVPALMEALKDKEDSIQAVALKSLGQIGPKAGQAVPAVKDMALKASNPAVRSEAVVTLGKLRRRRDRAVLKLLRPSCSSLSSHSKAIRRVRATG